MRKRRQRRIIILGISILCALAVITLAFAIDGKKKENKKQEVAMVERESTKEAGSSDASGPKEDSTSETNGTTQQHTSSEEDVSQEETTAPGEETTAPGENESDTEETTSDQQETTSVQQNVPSGSIDPSKPMVALTFDDGPAGEKTSRLLDALEANGAHATFFVVGEKLDAGQDIIKRAASIGCEIGNHSADHSDLRELDDAGVLNVIQPVAAKIKELTGQNMVICRPPYGAVNERVQALINAPVILWSIDTLDWKTRNVESTVTCIQQNVSDGDVILMHDIHEPSIEAAIQIIPWLKEQGYQLVTVSELGYYKRGGLNIGERYGSIQ